MTIRPPIPEKQFDLEISKSKEKVKCTPVSAVSCWLTSLVFHTSASYWFQSPFDPWQSGLPLPRYNLTLRSKVKVKGTPVSVASSWLISLVFHIRVSYRLRPFIRDTIWPCKLKVKSTPVSAASCWLISLVFHIRASYWLPSLSFHDNQASHSWDTIWPWKFMVKGQGQMS